MKYCKSSRRGIMMAELVVVLAIVMIATVMVVSFSTMLRDKEQRSRDELTLIQEINAAESLIDSFISGRRITDITESSVISADGSVKFVGTELRISIGGNESRTDKFEFISSIAFDKVEVAGDIIYFTTISYRVGEGTDTYTFTTYPFVGKEIGGGKG